MGRGIILKSLLIYIGLILGNILVYIYLGENVLLVTVIISLVLAILNHINNHEYICNNCKSKFRIKFYQIISFHAGNYRKLKCPVCGVVGLAQEVKDIKWLLDYANITILI